MAWLAIDRAIALASTHGLEAPLAAWKDAREEIRAEVLEQGIDPSSGAFTQTYGRSAPDAATLRLPLVGFVDPTSDVSRATLARVRDELSEGAGLLRRYRTDDGLPGREGAFLACSFWLAELQHASGDEAAARETFELAQRHASPLGLFSEEVDAATGDLRGNFPQAISHAAHLCAAHALRTNDQTRTVQA
jgi:GH15 family glucan-1,4-alpha-glucosidase